MAADEEIAGHEIAGEEVNPNPILPPTTDFADTCDAYAEIEYAGDCAASAIIPIVPFFEPGDSCDAYAETEYAGECVNPTAVFTSLPQSNIENFDDSGGRLGCGTPSVFFTSRCSQSLLCQIDLSQIISLVWTRKLDEISEAEVEIGLTGDSSTSCCECLSVLEPFCHELHIWRDGEEVWVGPVEAVRYERERVTVKARDVLSWMDVRYSTEGVTFQTTPLGAQGPDTEVSVIAQHLITKAFEEDVLIGYDCEVNNVFRRVTTDVIPFTREAFNETFAEMLLVLAQETNLQVTTLGRTIVLVPTESLSLTPLTQLNDEHIMGDIEVIKDGKLMANRYYVHWEGDGGVPGVGQKNVDERYCYGLIEKITDSGYDNETDAEVYADSLVENSFIAPKIVEIPDGSRLSPDTPWTIGQMVPGARVNVAISRLCLELTQSFYLTGVSVEYNEADGESVGVTLFPINSVSDTL